jgi:hypothetical protein
MAGVGNTYIKMVSSIILIVMLLVPVISCSSPEPATPQPKPETPPAGTPPSEDGQLPVPLETPGEWLADGIIGDGEYADTQSYTDFELWWTADEQFIYIAMKAKTTGWVSMALSSGPAMKDADMVLGFVQDSTVTVIDQYSTGNFGPHRPDSELGGSDDILESGGSEGDGYTIIEFKRKLDTGDTYDHKFSQGENSILWAYGQGDQPEQKHSARGKGELEL